MFKKNELLRLLGQAVKTPPSHGGIRGSTPLGATRFLKNAVNSNVCSVFLFRNEIKIYVFPHFSHIGKV